MPAPPAAPPTSRARSSAASAPRRCNPRPPATSVGAGLPSAGAAAHSAVGGEPPRCWPVAERRLVSILFADLVGFTTLAEGRDAEDTRELLTRYFELSRDVIARYGGTVEKFIGDAVMAVWGAPIAHEDDAERAVRAALELVDAVQDLGPGIQARAGVLTGEAAVTLGATNQGMVAGDLVNTASRLQSVAAPGHASWSARPPTARHPGRSRSRKPASRSSRARRARCRPGGRCAWSPSAAGATAPRPSRPRSSGATTSFVCSRTSSMPPAANAAPGSCRVIGPAGIGKTRLAWEFLKYLDGLVETVWCHDRALAGLRRGHQLLGTRRDGPRTGRPARDGRRRDDADQDRRDARDPRPGRGGATLDRAGAARPARRRDDGRGSEQLFGAWRTFFERLAATAPVVMVFEDFHFADAGLIDFVDHLLEWSRNVPIYVVTLSRPELLEKRPDWGAGKRNFVSLYLEPLPESAMRELLAGLVPGLPASAVKAIVERADGIPLYAVETVRMLLADGRLASTDGTYRAGR